MERPVKVSHGQCLEQCRVVLSGDFVADDKVAIENDESLEGAFIVFFDDLNFLDIRLGLLVIVSAVEVRSLECHWLGVFELFIGDHSCPQTLGLVDCVDDLDMQSI